MNRHGFPTEPPNRCSCWDCAAMGDGEVCCTDCVVCNHPEARTEWCADCLADTWHDDGECLRCGLGYSTTGAVGPYANPQGDVPWGVKL